MKNNPNKPWHALAPDEVLNFFGVKAETGLSNTDVKANRDKFGKNELPMQKPKPAWLLFLEQFNNPIIYVLLVAAVLNAVLSDLKDTIVIGVVVLLNALIGFFQERKASDALGALRQMAAPMAKVLRLQGGHHSIRESQQQLIKTSEVVCGDVIMLESGMRVPADARLLESQSLLVDESMLTGESFSITKKSEAKVNEKSALGDRLTMVYSGTIINKGRAVAVVTSVGEQTEIGKISQNVNEAEDTESPLQMQVEKFGKGLSFSILAIVIAIFAVGFLRGNDWITMFLTSVGLAVSAIPEGLPIAVTITLSIGVYQMAKHNSIVKKLAAVETLGSTNVICTDKTGTLTLNQMRVAKLFCGGKEYSVSGEGYGKAGVVCAKDSEIALRYDDNQPLTMASMIGALCTESTIVDDGDKWKITGDPTEVAMMIAANKLKYSTESWKIDTDIPFESENQLMAVRATKAGLTYNLAKGAPEKILCRCNSMLDAEGNIIELDNASISAETSELSNQGLRVIAMAYSVNEKNAMLDFDNLNNLIFAGFAAIEDTVKPEAINAVADCNSAGIRVVMITGDHPKTASAVGKAIGLGSGKDYPVAVTGHEVDEMTDDDLFGRVPDIDVYARVAPNHKYRIVKQLQRHNNTVAMTGDGVNDAPALKQADIGVAMGSGTDVAKESAAMVLMDDNFASIVRAVRQGRVILHNLQHILLYILATSAGGLLTLAVSVAVGFPLPLLPAQLLWVNLVTDGTSTVPLAFEKEHGNVMFFAPRAKGSALVTKEIIYRIVFAGLVMMVGTLGIYMVYMNGIIGLDLSVIKNSPENMAIYSKAQTMAFCILAFFQIWNTQNSRSVDRSIFFNLPYKTPEGERSYLDAIGPTRNKVLLGIMLLAIALQVSAVTIPAMNTVFDTVPLSFNEWGIVFSVSFSIIIIIEAIKYIRALMQARGAAAPASN